MVSIHDVTAAARAGLASVTPETAGYLVLAAADRLAGDSRRSGNVRLREDGGVDVDGSGMPVDEQHAESALRTLLAELLSAGPPRPSALTRAATSVEPRGLARFVAELEAALIPVNRAAAKRALARLYRDVVRAQASGRLTPSTGDERVAAVPAPAPAAEANPTGPVAVAAPASPRTISRKPEIEPVAVVAPAPAAESEKVVPPAELLPSTVKAPVVTEFAWVAQGPDATPFLGSWVGVTSPARSVPEHDTDPAPPVAENAELPEGELEVVPAFASRMQSLWNANGPGTPLLGGLLHVGPSANPATVPEAVEASPLPVRATASDSETASADASWLVDPAVDAASDRVSAEPDEPSSVESSDSEDEPLLVVGASAPKVVVLPFERIEAPVFAVYHPRKSDVAELVAGFGVAEAPSLTELSRELKHLAGIAATPGPGSVGVRTSRAGDPSEATVSAK